MPWTVGLAVRVLTHERTHMGRRRVVEALVELAREQRLAGVTVMRAFTEASGSSAQGSDGAPVIVEMVDRMERIEPALPRIASLVPQGALSVTETRIYLPASRLRASDAHERPEQTLTPDMPAADALHMLLRQGVRLIPVLDAARRPVGVITLNHVLRQIAGELSAPPLDLSQPEQLRERLLAQLAGKRARDLARSPALSVSDDAPLDAVARYLTGHHITRAITVDGQGRCTGIVSEHALARLMMRPLLLDDTSAPPHLAEAHAEARATLTASVEPMGGARLRAGTLADRAVPRLLEAASWDEVTGAIEVCGVALVVDAQGRLRGVIEEGVLLERATGAPREGGLSSLRRLLAQATGQREAMTSGQTRDLRADALLQPARLIEAPETPLAQALAHMVTAGGVDYAVVTAPDAAPVGVLWRQDALRALVGG
ncbi:MAG TPA: DUF190 domain-containing protein [Ktedonobacterales bacterium]|jgi:CBS domain-containing protein|nr:DUF190 domain-containing protein [Ktedonobacterales bacterium]